MTLKKRGSRDWSDERLVGKARGCVSTLNQSECEGAIAVGDTRADFVAPMTPPDRVYFAHVHDGVAHRLSALQDVAMLICVRRNQRKWGSDTMRFFGLGFAAAVFVRACVTTSPADDADQRMLAAARNIVDAVNAKDSDRYVRDLADDVVVTMYDGDVRLRGRDAVRANREQHFLSHSQARNKLVHLVAIDQRVVMHDQVWLRAGQSGPADIVEVFTFENGKIVRIDVLQPTDLFSQ